MIDFVPPPGPSDRFVACLPFTLEQECPFPRDWSNPKNFSNDAHDPGGKTMCGIIQREYDTWRKQQGLPTRDVRALTETEGREIYETSYWHPHCDQLLPGLDLSFFDESVNTGTTEATKVLQHVLGLTVDGQWGPATAAAVLAIKPASMLALIDRFTDRRMEVYRAMRGFPFFGGDWIRRSKEIGEQSRRMASP